MSNYSGKTEFVYEVERLKDVQTGLYYQVDEFEAEQQDEARFQYELVKLKIKGSAYFSSGNLYGPMENCYPDEGDVELESALGPDNKNWVESLTDYERDLIIEEIDLRVQEDTAPDSGSDYEYDPIDPGDVYDKEYDY